MKGILGLVVAGALIYMILKINIVVDVSDYVDPALKEIVYNRGWLPQKMSVASFLFRVSTGEPSALGRLIDIRVEV